MRADRQHRQRNALTSSHISEHEVSRRQRGQPTHSTPVLTPLTPADARQHDETAAQRIPLTPLTPPALQHHGGDCMATQTDELLTVPEVMAALRLGRSTVYDLIRSHRLVSIKVGSARRIPADAVREFITREIQEAA